ncbi:hypothetical protein [Bosea sp. 685]|uniref:hypothetical protein n=1 Tax=Bosea sp. 685 TaxID=3080057 RepID=UPI002892D349|nr:hypothetical protein [Bosea sp. 685]WNJ89947.1 hypothetical protein RMR04_26735 [Bosea sp. 685]
MDLSTAQRATVTDGRMIIAGVPGHFVQAPARRLTVEASGLTALSGYALRDGALANDGRIAAQARLPEDGLGRAGLSEEAGEMPLAIRPLPEGGTAARMLLVLAYGQEEPGYHATLWLPEEIFSALKQDVEAGRAGRLSLVATTSLWLDEAERDTPAERRVAWRLGPDPDDEGSAPARGLVERIAWSAAAAPLAPAEDEPEETVTEALRRLNWSLKQIALVLVFLMIVAALK